MTLILLENPYEFLLLPNIVNGYTLFLFLSLYNNLRFVEEKWPHDIHLQFLDRKKVNAICLLPVVGMF